MCIRDRPSARYYPALATSSQVVLFGGWSQANAALGDMWTWNGTTWALRTVAAPTARDASAVAVANGNIVVWGGYGTATLADTWTWNATVWTKLTGTSPTPESGASAATLNGTLVLFGGSDNFVNSGQTWLLEGSVWTLSLIHI